MAYAVKEIYFTLLGDELKLVMTTIHLLVTRFMTLFRTVRE